MNMCLEQSMWAFVQDEATIEKTHQVYTYKTLTTISYIDVLQDIWWDILHDPWRSKQWYFSSFVQQYYGNGVVMHC